MASANPIFAVEQGNRNKNFVKNSFDFFRIPCIFFLSFAAPLLKICIVKNAVK